MNFVDFCVFTNHKRIDFDDNVLHNVNKHGPNPGIRSKYRPDHPQSSSHYRQVCNNPTKGLPCFVGASFASPDIEAERLLYCASMQVLYRNWYTWDDVMIWAGDWESSFQTFYDNSEPFIKSCVENTQLCRQARDAADADHLEEEIGHEDEASNPTTMVFDDEDADENVNDFEVCNVPPPYMEKMGVMNWAEDGVRLGTTAGLLPHATHAVDTAKKSLLNEGASTTSHNLHEWLEKMDTHAESVVKGDDKGQTTPASYVIPGFEPGAQSSTRSSSQVQGPEDIRNALNPQQRLAFDIVAEHLARTMDNTTQPPAQLLMKVLGPPGTGKSRVIDALTQHFERCNARPILQKCAHQGSAASIIGGSTLYSLLCIKVSSKT